jgi:HSP20 family protein
MDEAATKPPVKSEASSAGPSKVFEWRPFDTLRNQLDRLFHDFELRLLRRLGSAVAGLR